VVMAMEIKVNLIGDLAIEKPALNRRLTNRRLRNWRIKMCGKQKAVDRRLILNIKLIGDQ